MINSNFKKKGVFHFHSKYSFDSNTSISKIVDIIEDYKLDFVVLTDHNSVMGSLKLNEEIKRRQLNVDVPIAVEYSTECGDIIVVGPKNLISFSDINDLIIKAKEYDSVIILPHPYDYHKLGSWVENVDCIEVFNGRSSGANNDKSLKLAKKYNKNKIYASDAHLSTNISNVIIGYDSDQDFLNYCRTGDFHLISFKSSSYTDIYASQLIKSYKIKSFKLFIVTNFNMILNYIRNKFPSTYSHLKKFHEKTK